MSLVQDHDKVFRNMAQSYVTRRAKQISTDDFIIQRPKEATTHHLSSKVLKFGSHSSSVLPLASNHIFPVMADQMFGG
jgi:hypothetical protein